MTNGKVVKSNRTHKVAFSLLSETRQDYTVRFLLRSASFIGPDDLDAANRFASCTAHASCHVRAHSAPSREQGNRATVTEVKADENGLFSIQGTEKEIAMPDFWLEIMHYCSKTRPVVERKYERYIDPFYYYNAKETRTPWIYNVRELDLLDDS